MKLADHSGPDPLMSGEKSFDLISYLVALTTISYLVTMSTISYLVTMATIFYFVTMATISYPVTMTTISYLPMLTDYKTRTVELSWNRASSNISDEG